VVCKALGRLEEQAVHARREEDRKRQQGEDPHRSPPDARATTPPGCPGAGEPIMAVRALLAASAGV
jgi:hypothetical protein